MFNSTAFVWTAPRQTPSSGPAPEATDREILPGVTVNTLAWVFVALGIIARLTRYAFDFPLTGDEDKVAANIGLRSFGELLEPLDYCQVAPSGFLFAAKGLTELLGFNDYAMRLPAIICGILSLLAFRHLAARLLSGMPYVFAVAFLAAAYFPIRLSAEIKPYAGDLLCAIVLTDLALCLWRPKSPTWHYLALLIFTPLALALSFPAVFVAGGLVLGALIENVRTRSVPGVQRTIGFALVLCAGFGTMYLLTASNQYQTHAVGMHESWASALPTLSSPLHFLYWLLKAHCSDLFAYPIGGEDFASTGTFLLFVLGVVGFAKGRLRAELMSFAGMFGLAFVAAMLGRYPYGGHPRLGQFAGPAICLVAGAGLCALVSLLRSVRLRTWTIRTATAALLVLCAACIVRDAFLLYPDPMAGHREFARVFWPQHSTAHTRCLLVDLGVKLSYDSKNAGYVVLQRMYRRPPEHGTDPRQLPVGGAGEFYCVLYHSGNATLYPPAAAKWWRNMLERFEVTGCEVFQVTYDHSAPPDEYEVLRFQPRPRRLALRPLVH